MCPAESRQATDHQALSVVVQSRPFLSAPRTTPPWRCLKLISSSYRQLAGSVERTALEEEIRNCAEFCVTESTGGFLIRARNGPVAKASWVDRWDRTDLLQNQAPPSDCRPRPGVHTGRILPRSLGASLSRAPVPTRMSRAIRRRLDSEIDFNSPGLLPVTPRNAR